MAGPDIAILINSYNRLSLLKECLELLNGWVPYSQFNNRCVAFIYDAGSTDGSIQWLEEKTATFKIPLEMIIPKPGDDTSFAAGLNTAALIAHTNFPSIEYLLLYETDNQILDSSALLNALNQLTARKSLAACGFTVRRHDGTLAGVGMPFPTLLNFALGKNIVHKFQLEAIQYNWEKTAQSVEFSEVDVVFTSPLLVKSVAWKETAGLDSSLFPFSDCDIDWARRLRNMGWKMGVIRTNAAIHDNKESISSWSNSRALQFHRGRLRYFKRYRPFSVFIVWPVLLLLRHLLELITTSLVVKEKVRRSQLYRQFTNLLRNSIKGYQ